MCYVERSGVNCTGVSFEAKESVVLEMINMLGKV